MIDILWFFLPGILILGSITSYEDIKFGKIRNKYIIAALAYAVLVYLGFILFNLKNLNNVYLIELGVNFLFVVAIGFVHAIIAVHA